MNIYATFLMTLSILLCFFLICETAPFVEKEFRSPRHHSFFNLAVNNVYTPLVVL